MLKAMHHELVERTEYLQKQPVETIYFGGGTPSLLSKDELLQFLKSIHDRFDVTDNVEVTLEANPDDCTEKNLTDWKLVGINRLSIGIQSFKSKDLQWMNRAHTAWEAENCVKLAQNAGFENLTVDLMYGLPDLSELEWKQHIQKVIDWGVPHVSSYCLTVESGTLLEKKVNSGSLKVANDEEESRQFEILVETLKENGIHQYEISNFAKPGHESRHNSNYWKGVNYLGIGPSAHSFQGASRQWNVANNFQYMNGVEKHTSYSEKEQLTPSDRFNELILTGLRTIYGVSIERLSSIQNVPLEFEKKTAQFKNEGWMIEKDGCIYLTLEGRLKADFIASELFIA